jgi:DNA-binding transcriptional MocR family regulator
MTEGRLAAGVKLPALRKLAEHLKVSTNTIGGAIRVLEREGCLSYSAPAVVESGEKIRLAPPPSRACYRPPPPRTDRPVIPCPLRPGTALRSSRAAGESAIRPLLKHPTAAALLRAVRRQVVQVIRDARSGSAVVERLHIEAIDAAIGTAAATAVIENPAGTQVALET